MPSGPKKRKSAKKKKELEETLKNAPDIQGESIPERTTDSVLTTAQKDEEGDCGDTKKNILNQDLVPDDSIKGNPEAEILKTLTQTEDGNDEDEVSLSENSKRERFKPIFIQELQGIMLEVEGLKGTVIQQLQTIEKVTTVLHKIVDDFN